MTIDSNKRIAKNTLMLYIRMFFTMAISLFTARIILATLGETDFGIYNVVGGIVAMFGVLTHTLATATQRFLNFSLGKDEFEETRKTFSMSLIIHVLLALFILIISETIGLWFLNHKMNIPANRLYATQWVYQFSIFASIVSIIRIPYNASIIANEKMTIYAYVSIVEAILKLIVVYILLISKIDVLITYGALILSVHIIVFGTYFFICTRSFEETKFKYIWDKKLFKTMLSYSGWNTMSGFASVLSTEGINILLNVFFGPVMNAARGIALKVSNSVKSFGNSFQIAVNPQIVKLYAKEERIELFKLVINNSKYAFYLMSLIVIPFILEIDFILNIWLKEVPKWTNIFSQIILFQALFSSLHAPLAMGIHAHGKMKIPNLTVSIVHLLILPISYLFLKLGYPVFTPFIVVLASELITIVIDLFLLRNFIAFPVREFVRMSFRAMFILFIAVTVPIYVHLSMDLGWQRFIIVFFTSFAFIGSMVYFFGLSKSIRLIIRTRILKAIKG